jgi:hypothetical protein
MGHENDKYWSLHTQKDLQKKILSRVVPGILGEVY